MALAHRGGRPYEDLVQTRVINRIGLQDTTFYPPQAMGPHLAGSHDLALKPMPPLDIGVLTAARALRSTPRDPSRFVAAILSGSGMAPEAQLLLSVRRGAPWSGVQALGWEVRDAPGGGVGTADIARHLLRPQVSLGGQGGTRY